MPPDGSTRAIRYEQAATVMLITCACVCDALEIEAALPDSFIGNERVFPSYVQRLVTPSLAQSVFLLRRKSAWVNGDIMLTIVKRSCHGFEAVSTPVAANPLVGCIEIALVSLGAACCWSEGNMDDCDSGNDNLVAAAR